MMSDDDAKKWHAQTWPMMRKIILDHVAEIDAGKLTARAALVCIVSEKHVEAGGFRVCLCGLMPGDDETSLAAGRHLATTCVRVLDLIMGAIGEGDEPPAKPVPEHLRPVFCRRCCGGPVLSPHCQVCGTPRPS